MPGVNGLPIISGFDGGGNDFHNSYGITGVPTNYIFFPQKCSIGENNIEQFTAKKLTSDSINVTNNGEAPARVVIVSK